MRCCCYLSQELGLEGLLSPEDLAEEWEDNFRDMRAQLRKCDGAEEVTRRLKELGIPQVTSSYYCTSTSFWWLETTGLL